MPCWGLASSFMWRVKQYWVWWEFRSLCLSEELGSSWEECLHSWFQLPQTIVAKFRVTVPVDQPRQKCMHIYKLMVENYRVKLKFSTSQSSYKRSTRFPGYRDGFYHSMENNVRLHCKRSTLDKECDCHHLWETQPLITFLVLCGLAKEGKIGI